MSGDVQPRKRKDKKKKKDELSLEEPRGTAAALGEGDVFMHSYHDHGTGGHWCAKVIFFSLLAVLITLIGLIILENRGLSELEANSVESRYSGVLEGWLEDTPDDDHHDVHTLELKHHGDDEAHDLDDHEDEDHGDDDIHENEIEDTHEDEDTNEDEDDDDHEDEDEDEPSEQEDEDEEDEQEESEEQDVERDEDEDEEENESYDAQDLENEDDEAQEDDNEDQEDEDEQNEQEDEDEQNDLQDEQENSQEATDNEDEDEPEHDDEEDEDDEVEVEKIEQEASEEEPISTELPALPEEDDEEDSKDHDDDVDDSPDAEDDEEADNDDDDDDEFLEADNDDDVVERITAPAGKPFVEVEEDETSSERPPDTLEEEEKYEKQQEELRREEEQSSHMWLKLSVGGALLAATHAVWRRAAAPRDEATDEREAREETPADRRMTRVPEESSTPVVAKKVQESERPGTEEVVRREAPVLTSPADEQESDEEESEEHEEFEEETEELEEPKQKPEKDEELFSDEEEVEEEEEEIVVPKKEPPKFSAPPPSPKFSAISPPPKFSAPPPKQPAPPPAPEPEPEPEPDDEVPDDVEIIDDEQLEEEIEEEDEDDISDVDDEDLLTRLEAKYGRLPEPERPGQKHKDGGDSVEDMWPGEPSDSFWRDQLDSAEQDLRQGEWSSAIVRAGAPELASSGRARYLLASALDRQAEAKRDNRILTKAITAYLELLKMNENLSDKKLVETARRTLDRIQFRGNYLNAEPVYRLLIRRFPNESAYRNNLTISFLMANRADLAADVLKETLVLWPEDRVALAHYAFVLKTHYNKHEEAVDLFQRALEGDKGPACEPRFYYHYGDALLLLGKFKEAHEVHVRGAKHGHFLSPAQRSLYNVPRLKAQPWWDVNSTPFTKLAKALEKSWKEILKEGEAAKALYEQEKEGLKERGDWSQMDLFVRGREVSGRCARAPVTCGAVRSEPAAGCRRGQVKFSALAAGSHVRPHVGPTNCRLRMHLGLSNTKDTYIRVDREIRQWQEGKVLLFDDSFEHEVWHNGTGTRLVLIVDVWHPELSPAERRALPAI